MPAHVPRTNAAPANCLCSGADGGTGRGRRAAQMSQANQELRSFVGRVVAFETGRNASSTATTPVAFVVCEKLRPQWVNFMGDVGFRTLLSRALTMAHQRVPWLSAVQVNAEGVLAWSGKMEPPADPDAMGAGSAVLVAELLGLLEGFIGEALALRLLQDVWPKLPLNDSGSDKEK